MPRIYSPRLKNFDYKGPLAAHLVFVTRQRSGVFANDEAAEICLAAMNEAAQKHRATIHAYCLMPDHMHLLWIGILPESDQRLAARFFRKQLNPILEKLGARFQQQPHDHVLTEDERERSAFENVVEYIARNPERAQLVPENGFREYAYTGCLVPGYPELKLWQPGFWDRFWRIYAHLAKHGVMRHDEAE